AVRYLVAEAGIRQFLDIGTGLPTTANVHDVAQAVEPSARVVYADNDPMVLAHARALLTSTVRPPRRPRRVGPAPARAVKTAHRPGPPDRTIHAAPGQQRGRVGGGHVGAACSPPRPPSRTRARRRSSLSLPPARQLPGTR
ncbi:MAG TPA: SAM-dependent methyltransferase, partial [Trebonia sp.]|nr:SAM-dependent methyltransferase [Trebonia sp.]